MRILITILALSLIALPFTACDDSGDDDPCGNGIIDPGEECDGADTNGETCISQGYYAGTLICTASCTFSLNSCASSGMCGDGVIQSAYEVCEGANMGGRTCSTLGYGSGTLECTDACQFDVSGCISDAVCGDDIIEGTEECEGVDLSGETCETLGYYGGTLTCSSLCLYDMTSCAAFGYCGDGLVQATSAEECDSTDLDGSTCETLGFAGGDLTCGGDCTFDTTACTN